MGNEQALRVGAMQLNGQPDPEQNFQQIRQQMAALHQAQACPQLLVLPECFGYFGGEQSQWLAHAEHLDNGPMQAFASDIARQYGIWLVAGSIPLRLEPGHKVSASCLVYDHKGKRVARYDKAHLFDVDVGDSSGPYRESDYTEPGERLQVVSTPWGRLGLAVCYDIRFPELFRSLRGQGADLFVLPAAFTHTTGKAHWEPLLRARAIENQCFLIAANQAGEHVNGRSTWGHSMIIDPWGEVLAEQASGIGCAVASLSLERLHSVRRSMPVEQHNKFSCHWRHEGSDES